MNILIVEDEPVSRKLVSVVLEAEGHSTTYAEPAETAPRFVKRRKPDLIILDIMLPNMDGLRLTREIKRDSHTARIPVIAMTASRPMERTGGRTGGL